MGFGQQREQGLEGRIRSLLPELSSPEQTKTLDAEEMRKQRKLRGARTRPLPQRTQDREQVTGNRKQRRTKKTYTLSPVPCSLYSSCFGTKFYKILIWDDGNQGYNFYRPSISVCKCLHALAVN